LETGEKQGYISQIKRKTGDLQSEKRDKKYNFRKEKSCIELRAEKK